MEYASGGELFERICNAGRFSEDEVRLQLTLFLVVLKHFYWCANIHDAGTLFLPTTHFWSQLLSFNGMHFSSCFSPFSYYSCLPLWLGDLVKLFLLYWCILSWSKYATVTWNWRIHCWMEVRLLASRFVILGTPRYKIPFLIMLTYLW